jgi:hypothetical protein
MKTSLCVYVNILSSKCLTSHYVLSGFFLTSPLFSKTSKEFFLRVQNKGVILVEIKQEETVVFLYVNIHRRRLGFTLRYCYYAYGCVCVYAFFVDGWIYHFFVFFFFGVMHMCMVVTLLRETKRESRARRRRSS